MAHRRKRITVSELAEVTESLRTLPITVDFPGVKAVLQLPNLALKYQLTAYDAAYLELAVRLTLPIATKDSALKRAMDACGVRSVQPRNVADI